jgi:AcrR family transcriptional regulator
MDETNSRAARRAASGRRILAAAQAEFGEHGFDRTTVRAIAERAGVDPALVMQHYGSKADLFAIATRLAPESTAADVDSHLLDVLDVRLKALPPETRALVRSMLTTPQATAAMRDFLDDRIANLAGTLESDDAELRAALAVCAILGLTVARHFLELGAVTEITDAELTEIVRPWLSAALR